MNPAYISAFSALAGALIGGLTSFGTSWFTQQTQLRHSHREAERAKLEALYNDFIAEAARLFGDSLTHQTDDITSMVRLYGTMVPHPGLCSSSGSLAMLAAIRRASSHVSSFAADRRRAGMPGL